MVLLIWFKVYKKWYLNVLEASFIMNLLTLAVATISVKYISDDANQTSIMALLYTSCSVAGATFFGILLFHAWFQLKDTKICKKLLLRFKPSSNDDDVDKSVEIEYERMLNNNYAVPQTTSVVELSTSTSYLSFGMYLLYTWCTREWCNLFSRTPNCRDSRINHMFRNTFPMRDN